MLDYNRRSRDIHFSDELIFYSGHFFPEEIAHCTRMLFFLSDSLPSAQITTTKCMALEIAVNTKDYQISGQI